MITVLQPDATVPLERFTDWLEEPLRTVLLPEEPVPAASEVGDAVIVLGGRMNAVDDEATPFLPAVRSLLRELAAAEVPVLGICLGHQILADTFGGTVVTDHPSQGHEGASSATLNEAGLADPLFAVVAETGQGPRIPVARSHHDVVTALPSGATALATSEDGAIQAFRYGSAVAVQFHPEASPELMARWRSNSGKDASALLAEMREHDEAIAAAGRAIAQGFSRLVRARKANPSP